MAHSSGRHRHDDEEASEDGGDDGDVPPRGVCFRDPFVVGVLVVSFSLSLSCAVAVVVRRDGSLLRFVRRKFAILLVIAGI